MKIILQPINGLIMQDNFMRKKSEEEPPPRINTTTKIFTLQEVETGIKKLKIGKSKDLVKLQAEYLRWGMNILAPHIMEIFNNVIR